jgi:hypothetical protein
MRCGKSQKENGSVKCVCISDQSLCFDSSLFHTVAGVFLPATPSRRPEPFLLDNVWNVGSDVARFM